MNLYKYDKTNLQFIKIPLKGYIYTILIIALLFSSLGFGTGVSVKYEQIPKQIQPIFLNDDSSYLFLTDLDYNQIKLIESGNNEKAISTENAIGSMQITQISLDEWNKFHPNEQYTFDDLFIRKINIKIGKWMLSKQIPMYLKQNNIPNSLNYKLIIYNWGIGNFINWYKNGANYSKLPEETKSYLLKYWQKY